jgi:hypothetical protein
MHALKDLFGQSRGSGGIHSHGRSKLMLMNNFPTKDPAAADGPLHSYLSAVMGLVRAALTASKLTVRRAMR